MQKIKKTVKDTIIYILKAYIVLVIGLLVLQRSVMYVPDTSYISPPDSYGLKEIQTITKDDKKLISWYTLAKKGKPVIVMFHGNAGNISNRIDKMLFFTRKGYGFFLLEYRGYGPNTGRPSEEGLYHDARSALNGLKKVEGIKEENIIIYGESIGTGVASQMSIEFPKVKAIILEAPFTNMTDLIGDIYPWLWPFKSMVWDKFDNIKKVKGFKSPTLIIHGTNDRVIPIKHAKKLHEALLGNKKLIEVNGAGHNNLAAFGTLENIQSFITSDINDL